MNNYIHTNSLINELSPYLLQHAHNPVQWYVWGHDAFLKARNEDKLVIVSVGYSACHWCHVMESESFDDEEVALVMNENFISIKVDKEERPDIDQQYMSAVRIITGNGGWPLNVICLPDGRPIYGGTYFPRQQWIDILVKLSDLYKAHKEKVVRAAEDLAEGVRNVDLIEERLSGLDYLPKYLRLIVEPWKRKFDTKWGGTQSAPKFPMPSSIDFLMSYAYHMRDEEVRTQVMLTLNKIYEGGIYDHVGGGFHRYSVDGQWFLPHFEKMLYDNALLGMSYIYAYQFSKEPRYKRVALESLEFLLRDLYSSDKMFYTAIDADSTNGEGQYYVWDYSEICEVLDEDAPIFCSRFGVDRNGNFEYGKNILSIKRSFDELSMTFKLPISTIKDKVDLSLRKLFCARFLREKPKVDTKIILSWNALAAKTFALASSVFKEPRYLVVAIDCINGIERHLAKDGALLRTLPHGDKHTEGMLDDYAYLIEAYIALYSVTFDFNYLDKAENLANICLKDFFDDKSGMFFYTNASVELPLGRKMEVVDGVTPSSNSSLARSFYYLSIVLSRPAYKEIAVQMLANMQDQMSGAGPFVANWGLLLINLTFAPAEITLVGDNALQQKMHIDQEYLPNVFLFGAKQRTEQAIFKNRWRDGETTLHLCIANVCRDFKGTIEELKDNALELRNCYIL